MVQTEILKKYFHNLCNLVKERQAIDKLIWRFRGKRDGYEVKINTRNKSILSGLYINIKIYIF